MAAILTKKRRRKRLSQLLISSKQEPEQQPVEQTKITNFQQLERTSYRSAGMGHKKNQHVKVVDTIKIHNYWGNIFRRKAEMHMYFSEAAFGSQLDTKLELRDLWKDPVYRKKYLPRDYLDSDTENELK